MTQLSLGIALRESATFENFYEGGNIVLLKALKEMIANSGESFLYCYGSEGVGKTHLLQAYCHATTDLKQNTFYLPLKSHLEFSPGVLEGLEQFDTVCLDDIDAVVGILNWEEALFHLYNRTREQGARLIVTAERTPQQLEALLPDLQSRLFWGLVLGVQELSDAEKIEALKIRAGQRGFELPTEVAQYILNHQSRNMRDLFASLDVLDKASMVAQRKLTIPFVKSILG